MSEEQTNENVKITNIRTKIFFDFLSVLQIDSGAASKSKDEKNRATQ